MTGYYTTATSNQLVIMSLALCCDKSMQGIHKHIEMFIKNSLHLYCKGETLRRTVPLLLARVATRGLSGASEGTPILATALAPTVLCSTALGNILEGSYDLRIT